MFWSTLFKFRLEYCNTRSVGHIPSVVVRTPRSNESGSDSVLVMVYQIYTINNGQIYTINNGQIYTINNGIFIQVMA
jgi:hypothetical protein